METVNQRFTTGGPGPEGQADTVDQSATAATKEAVAEAATETVEPPAHSASKGDWVDFAVSHGADRDEAEAQTKQDLIDSYGQV